MLIESVCMLPQTLPNVLITHKTCSEIAPFSSSAFNIYSVSTTPQALHLLAVPVVGEGRVR